MKKLSLRTERLTELTNDQLRVLAGAAPRGAGDTINVSDGSCGVCIARPGINCDIDVSDHSCGVCTIGDLIHITA